MSPVLARWGGVKPVVAILWWAKSVRSIPEVFWSAYSLWDVNQQQKVLIKMDIFWGKMLHVITLSLSFIRGHVCVPQLVTLLVLENDRHQKRSSVILLPMSPDEVESTKMMLRVDSRLGMLHYRGGNKHSSAVIRGASCSNFCAWKGKKKVSKA